MKIGGAISLHIRESCCFVLANGSNRGVPKFRLGVAYKDDCARL